MKPDTNPAPTSGASQAGQPPAFPLVAGWPGLFFFIGRSGFKTIGYVCLLTAGALAGTHASLIGALIGALVFLTIGHLAICAAEVIEEMKREDEAEDSANDSDLPRRSEA